MGVWKHYREVPQCREMMESHPAVTLSADSSAFNASRTVKQIAAP
ncbi:unnamed protein product [Sphacelaria rigidula]